MVNGSIGKVVAFRSTKEALKEGLDIAQPQKDVKTAKDSQGSQNQTNEILPDILHKPGIWPVVKFASGRTCLCVPAPFEIINGDDTIKARREQV